jgi:hypothetical protein
VISDALDIAPEIARTAARNACLAYPPLFLTTYFKDSKSQPLTFEDYHLEIIDALTNEDIRRILILVPADHAKTTIARFCMTYKAVKDRNIRMMNIMNNATDAVQNLVAIERELEDPKSDLVNDFGQLKGDTWKTTEFNIAGRTIKDKEPTLAAYGTGSNVFGHRADLIVCDDLLNLENSGPQVTDETRKQLHDWFFQGVLKAAGSEGKVVVIGTVMDFRDLYHELGGLNDPAHKHETSWYHPKHKFHVIRMKALIDEETETVLWPARNPYSFLAAERDSDMTAFMKRYQNVAIESALLTFDEERARMCLNRSRNWGEVTKEMQDGGFTTAMVTFDPTSGRSRKSKWCGLVVGAYNPKQEPPRKFYVLEIFHFRALLEETDENVAKGTLGQADYLIDRAETYEAARIVIEANAAHDYAYNSLRLRKYRDAGHIVEPHYTTAENKYDPDMGVASISAITNALLIDFPYGDVRARREMDDFFAKELLPHPMSDTTDRLMALWFFILKANEYSERRFKVVLKKLPHWAGGRMFPMPVRKVS